MGITILQAVVAGEMVFVSGQLGFEPETGNLVPGGINPETRRTFDNMIAVLEAAGSCLKCVDFLGSVIIP